ncbi:hypothetical protein EOL96_01080 [Candidatus Saccharibacteria bacterium]|nr:hypothetical protein [Candidatus Saccharibacteria bacterium]
MFGIGEKQARRAAGQLELKELSLLMSDVDTVWCRDDVPVGDCEILHQLAHVAPRQAADTFRERLSETGAIQLEDRLNAVGIACGVLRTNGGVPGGVYGIWRSTLPVLLLSEQAPSNYDRATEIARGIGGIIYGPEVELVDEFAESIYGSFVEIDASRVAAAPTRRHTLQRTLGIGAQKR